MAQSEARVWVDDDDARVDTDGYAAAGWDDGEAPEEELAAGPQIAVVRPRIFRDAATIGEYYRQGVPVIVSLEDMDNAGATRIIDFISGLVLGLYGDIERISRRTFLIVPAGADILAAHGGSADEGFFNQE